MVAPSATTIIMAATLMILNFAASCARPRGIAARTSQALTGRLLPGVLLALLVSAAPAAYAQTRPVAGDDGPFSVDEGGSLSGSPSVLDNDVEPDGQPLILGLLTTPTHASLFNLNLTTGVITYTHDGSETTSDAFTYEICDIEGPPQCDRATVTFSINPVNDPPVAVPDAATVDEDTANNPIDVTENDTDAEGDTLDVTDVSANNGSVSVLGNSTVQYTPNPDYFGGDTINYTISDGNPGGVASSTVTVTVNPVPDAPVAEGQDVSTDEDTATGITLVATDADGDSLTYDIVQQPSNGSLSGSPPNVTYAPNANYNGSDSFTFLANDGTVNSNTATVSITVRAVNDAPVAENQGVSTDEDTPKGITLVATDPDGDSLTDSLIHNTAPTRRFTPTPMET